MNAEPNLRVVPGNQSYATELASYSEICATEGETLPHWQKLMQTLEKIGTKKLEKRRKEAQRMLRENGAAYNVFDSVDTQRSWQFDPIPLIIGHEEWAQLEKGLIQRAELLNLFLADVYGSRKLIEKGLLPPELVFSHNGFHTACVGLIPNHERHLNTYSANLARGRDGRYWVVEDRVQPVFGAGYALESRLVMSESFPQLFQSFQVHRLAPYFRALRERLTYLARQNKAEPHIVVLTPGPDSPSFFEHAYLAYYLGYPLVQGGDLVVRDGCVWLKTLSGLRQVDVILRRVADDLCDPLELRHDSLYGIPGLLEAVRLGNVTTANPVGSNVLENPALLAFLPGICRYFLGEELLLPSVATWWCGQPREREFVLQNLSRLIVKPIYAMADFVEMAPEQRSPDQLSVLRARIQANPQLYVGQERASFSTVPSFAADKIKPRHSILSTFLTAQEKTYVVMPGGLTRVSSKESSFLTTSHNGGHSKDTWVLTPEPEKQLNLWLSAQPNQQVQPMFSALPSRAAENLFWVGRHAERTEATSRLLRSILNKLREFNEYHDPDERLNLEHLLRALTHITSTFPGFVGEDSAEKLADPRAELLSLARDVDRLGSLRSSLRSLSRAAYAVRDRLPEDAWRVVENMQQTWNPKIKVSQIGSGVLYDSISKLILHLSAFSGLTNENMAREDAWRLLNIGRRLERAQNLIALLRATLVSCYQASMEAHMLETVLITCNSLIVFRRRYRSVMQLSTTLELLLMDEHYPRALAYQLQQIQTHIEVLPREQNEGHHHKDKILISEAIAELKNTDCKQLTHLSSSDGIYPLLEKLLNSQEERLDQLSATLIQLYFSPTLIPQQLGKIVQEKAS